MWHWCQGMPVCNTHRKSLQETEPLKQQVPVMGIGYIIKACWLEGCWLHLL